MAQVYIDKSSSCLEPYLSEGSLPLDTALFFQPKNGAIFLFLHDNIYFMYSLEAPL